jgi:hypothetical protein
MLCPA